MKSDPFVIKQYSKLHPKRLAFTLQARLLEQEAKFNFKKYFLPQKILSELPEIPNVDWSNTAVTPEQMQHLLYALSINEHLTDTVVVEVGAYQGVTSKCLAKATLRKYIAIDPYIGYGGCNEDYQQFQKNIEGLNNVVHERKTSGETFKNWQYGPVSLVFIDALHDYVNTAFDIQSWSSLLIPGGILAMHDTDKYCFAGTRKAVFEVSDNYTIFAHPDNLTILVKAA